MENEVVRYRDLIKDLLREYARTPDAFAEFLVERGAPRERIVLAFKPPEIRPYTGFAVA